MELCVPVTRIGCILILSAGPPLPWLFFLYSWLIMQYLVRIIQILYTCYAFAVFLFFLFLLFPLVVISSFFGKVNGGNMIYALCRFWADACFLLWGIRHRN